MKKNGPGIWEIPYHIEDETGHVYNSKVWVKADNKAEAIEYFVELLVEHGDEAVWGDDPDFDYSVERTERSDTAHENQMWYINGFAYEEDEEMPTKVLRFKPANAKRVTKSDVRYDDKFFDAND